LTRPLLTRTSPDLTIRYTKERGAPFNAVIKKLSKRWPSLFSVMVTKLTAARLEVSVIKVLTIQSKKETIVDLTNNNKLIS
jgi:hypothetical protein